MQKHTLLKMCTLSKSEAHFEDPPLRLPSEPSHILIDGLFIGSFHSVAISAQDLCEGTRPLALCNGCGRRPRTGGGASAASRRGDLFKRSIRPVVLTAMPHYDDDGGIVMIGDTGAEVHVIGAQDRCYMMNVRQRNPPCVLGTANGTIYLREQGDVLCAGLLLQHCVFNPHAPFSLASISCLVEEGWHYSQGRARCTITRGTELKELVRAGGLCLLGTLEALSALEDMSDIIVASRDPTEIIEEVIRSMRPVMLRVNCATNLPWPSGLLDRGSATMLQPHVARRYVEVRTCRHCLGEGHVAMACPTKGPEWERGRLGGDHRYAGALAQAFKGFPIGVDRCHCKLGDDRCGNPARKYQLLCGPCRRTSAAGLGSCLCDCIGCQKAEAPGES